MFGRKPEGFPTQRVALEGEGQLRWVGGFPSRALPLLPLRGSLVRVFACDLVGGFARVGVCGCALLCVNREPRCD